MVIIGKVDRFCYKIFFNFKNIGKWGKKFIILLELFDRNDTLVDYAKILIGFKSLWILQ